MKGYEKSKSSNETRGKNVTPIGIKAVKGCGDYEQPTLPGMEDDQDYIVSMRTEAETLIDRYEGLSLDTLQMIESNLRGPADGDWFSEEKRRKLRNHVCAAIVRKMMEIGQQEPDAPENPDEALFDLAA